MILVIPSAILLPLAETVPTLTGTFIMSPPVALKSISIVPDINFFPREPIFEERASLVSVPITLDSVANLSVSNLTASSILSLTAFWLMMAVSEVPVDWEIASCTL